jgi:hypothetical protein
VALNSITREEKNGQRPTRFLASRSGFASMAQSGRCWARAGRGVGLPDAWRGRGSRASCAGRRFGWRCGGLGGSRPARLGRSVQVGGAGPGRGEAGARRAWPGPGHAGGHGRASSGSCTAGRERGGEIVGGGGEREAEAVARSGRGARGQPAHGPNGLRVRFCFFFFFSNFKIHI